MVILTKGKSAMCISKRNEDPLGSPNRLCSSFGVARCAAICMSYPGHKRSPCPFAEQVWRGHIPLDYRKLVWNQKTFASPRLPNRPWERPTGWKWSEFILGRRRNLDALQKTGYLKVSCYETRSTGRVCYTDPVVYSRRGNSRIRYRVIVRLKNGAA